MSVIVYAQNWEGKFKKSTFELASYGWELARLFNLPLAAVTVGAVSESESAALGKFGIERLIYIEHPSLKCADDQVYAQALSDAVSVERGKLILFSHNSQGKAVAPRVAGRLNAAIVSGVSGLPTSFDPFIVAKGVFTGKATAQVKVNSALKVLTLSPNAFRPIEHPVTVRVVPHKVTIGQSATKLKEVQKTGGKRVPVNDAEILISGGRGMKGAENWGPIEELADLLNAGTSCTRPVSDEGWRPHYEHVGQTGKIVAPNLYVACGISGAIQHLGGVRSSKVIVAINKDPEAPIFETAQYGVVGDVLTVLPELVKAVKEFKAGPA